MLSYETRLKIGKISPFIFWRTIGTIVFPIGMFITLCMGFMMTVIFFFWITGIDEEFNWPDFKWSFKTFLIYGIPSTTMAILLNLS